MHQTAASPCASRKGEHDNETFQTTQRHRYVVNKGYAGRITDVSMAWEPGLSISRILGNDADSLGNSRQQLHRIRSRIPHLEQGFQLPWAYKVNQSRVSVSTRVRVLVCNCPSANSQASFIHTCKAMCKSSFTGAPHSRHRTIQWSWIRHSWGSEIR